MRCLLAVALVAVTACAEPAETPREPARTVTVERARKQARAGLLRAADVPGYRLATGEETDDEMFERGTCLRATENVAERARTFVRGDQADLVAATAVLPTELAVREDLAYLRSAAFRDCFERFITGLTAEQGLSIRDYRDRAMPVRVKGASGTFGLSARMTAHYAEFSAPVRVVVAGAVTDHTEVMLVATAAVDAVPPSEARLRSWLATAVARVRAVPL